MAPVVVSKKAASSSVNSATARSGSILPLRAAQLFDEDVQSAFGPWKILLSGRAIRDWRKLKDGGKVKTVTKMLIALSHGDFSGDNQKQLVGNHGSVPIFEAKVLGDLRLVYQVDLSDADVEGQVVQILKVWGLESHASIDKRLWSAVSNHWSKRSKEYRRRVLYRSQAIVRGAKASSVAFPQTFPFLAEADLGPLEAEGYSEEEMLKLHDLIALSKFIPCSKAVIASILAQDDEAAHVFNMSSREREVVEHESSSFVIGRSGTGKTTCILFKMLGLETAAEALPEARAKLRQVFVTQSPVLASKVRTYYTSLITTIASTNITPEEAEERGQIAEAADLDDLEADSAGRAGLPKRFSELEDHHFPLFLSYDVLLSLLEADFGIDWGQRSSTEGAKAAFRRHRLEAGEGGIELLDVEESENIQDTLAQAAATSRLWERYVDLDTFKAWFSSFDQRVTKGIDPNLCWAEVLGTIRGSETAVGTLKGYLSKDEYLGLSERSHSTYASSRETIYEIFKAYLKRKASNFDRSDRTHALIGALESRPLPAEQQFDAVYVDEAQDLLIADTVLLRKLSSNPRGWLFAGDTAQTIAAGSAFRFDDLKAAVYRSEEKQAKLAKRKPVDSKLFSLALNYRSHHGITAVGSAIVTALLELFPESIDRLPPETGLVKGPKPVWLIPGVEGADENLSHFLFGESGSAVEFGAEQCILVRNEAARETLRIKTGEVGLIMTIAESKGLEFSDVLLVDFFADSSANASDWRVILNLCKDAQARGGLPKFDAIRHAAIGQELRHLYVAVTRARNVLWIVDRDLTGESMRSYFEALGIIKTCRPGDKLPVIAAASSAESWLKQGRAMYSRKLYRQAALCFGRAGAELERRIAIAYDERRLVRLSHRQQGRAPLPAYRRVAGLFCDAAEASEGSQRVKLYVVAADLYLLAERTAEAAKAFELAGDFDRSALLYLRARSIDDAVRVVKAHPGEVPNATRDKVYYPGRLHFLRSNKLESARTLFHSDDELLDFADDYGFSGAQRSIFISLGRFKEAAKLDLTDGNLRSAANLFVRAGDDETALRYLVDLLGQQLPFGSSDDWTDEKRFNTAKKLLTEIDELLARVDETESKEQLRREIKMHRLVTLKRLGELRTLGLAFRAEGNDGHALSALDVALSEVPNFRDATVAFITSHLADVEAYASLVRRFVARLQIHDLPTRRLLGLQASEADQSQALAEITILPTSPLFHNLPRTGDSNESRVVSIAILPSLAKEFLLSRLDDFIFLTAQALESARVLYPPCLSHSFKTDGCPLGKKCDRQHRAPSELTQAAVQARVDAIESVIRVATSAWDYITESLPGAEQAIKRRTETTKWLSILASTLYPVNGFAGAATEARDRKLDSAAVARIGSRAQDALLQIPDYPPHLLLPRFFRLSSLFVESSPPSALSLVSRLPFVASAKEPYFQCKGWGMRRGTVQQKLVKWLLLPPQDSLAYNHLRSILDAVEVILDKPLAFDAPLLVTMLEDLGAIAILSRRNKTGSLTDWSWHELELPTSIMRRALRLHETRRVIDVTMSLFMEIVKRICQATTSLIEGGPHLHVEGRGSELGAPALPVLALRLLRLLGLMGQHNQRKTQQFVVDEMSKMADQLGPRVFERPYVRFFQAQTYEALEAESRVSRFPLDQSLLLDLSPGASLEAPAGVRVVRATTLAAIRLQLFTSTSLSASADVFVPGSTAKEEAPQEEEEAEISAEEQAAIEAAQATQEANRIAAENAAATVIQRKIRTFLRRQKDQQEHATKPFTRYWLMYAAAGRSNRREVLGPVVEIAYALETTSNSLLSQIKSLKKSWSAAKIDLADMGDLITLGNKLKQALIAVIATLKPSDPLIIASNLAKIKPRIQSAAALFAESQAWLKRIAELKMKGISRINTEQLEEKMRVGVKGALAVTVTTKQQRVEEKPALGKEEDDEIAEEREAEIEEQGRRLA